MTKKIILTLLIAVFFLYINMVFISYYKADIYYVKSQAYLKQGEMNKALSSINKAVKLNSGEPNYYKGRAKIYITAAFNSQVEKNNIILYKNLSLVDLQKAYALNPNNLATIRNIVPLYYYLAVKSELGTKNIEPDKYFLASTLNYYELINNVAPNDVGIYTLMTKYYKKLDRLDKYTENVERVRKLRPDLLEWNEVFK